MENLINTNNSDNLYYLCSLYSIQREDYIEYCENMLKLMCFNDKATEYYHELIKKNKICLEKLKNNNYNSIEEIYRYNPINFPQIFYKEFENFIFNKLKFLITNEISKLSKKEAILKIDEMIKIIEVVVKNKIRPENIIIKIPKKLIYKYLVSNFDKEKVDKNINKKTFLQLPLINIYKNKKNRDNEFIISNVSYDEDDIIDKMKNQGTLCNNVIKHQYAEVFYLDIISKIENSFDSKKSLKPIKFSLKKLFYVDDSLRKYFVYNILKQYNHLLESSYSGQPINLNIFTADSNAKNLEEYMNDLFEKKMKKQNLNCKNNC